MNLEKELLNKISFDENVLDVVKKISDKIYKSTIDYVDENDNKISILGLSFKILKDDSLIKDTVRTLRIDLPIGYFPFISKVTYLNKEADPKGTKEITIIKANDVYDVIQKIGTYAPNFDLTTEDIIKKLKEWEKICSFEIFEITDSSISIEFKTVPDDLKAFGEDIYEFCPDTIEQGYYGPPIGDFQEDDDVDFFEALYDAIEIQTPETLSNYFKTNRDLFLWWD